MTETNKSKEPPQPGGNDRKPERRGGKSRTQYTPRQQETIRQGLRIWARVAIRSYLRQRAGEPHTQTGPAAEE